jgi:two-component system sensor kinase FixL
MNWITIIWSMGASACLTLAAMYLLIWCNRRTAWSYLLFSIMALATAFMAFCEFEMMRAETPAQFATALRWMHVPALIIVMSTVGFVLVYLRAGRWWLAWTICALRAFTLLINFLVGQNLNYLEVTHLRSIPFLGESVSIAEGVSNPWMLVGQLSLVLWLVFVTDAATTVWRRGDRRLALVVGGSFVVFALASTVQTVLVLWQIVASAMTPSLFYMVIVAAMGGEMARETLRAGRLSDDLSKKEEWLDLAADSAGVGLWLWDFKTNLIWATERTRILYGFSLEELIPFEKFLSRLHPDDLNWVVQASQKCFQEGADFRSDYRIVLPDGSIRWLKVLAKALLVSAGAPKRMTGVSIDITERKQIEMELQQKRNELNHVTRVSTMGQLASTLAHELSQPLGAILRNAEAAELILQDPSPDLGELRAILEDICKDDQRAGDVIERMRAMLTKRKTEKCRLDLKLLTVEVITLVQTDADKRHVRLALDIGPALPPVHGDRVQLQQVLINLLLNAFDALDDNLQESPLITVSARPVGETVEVAVSDNGPGIAEDNILHVFEPFFSSKSNGLGMGLTISRDIIKAHGGWLCAKNNEAGGATFTITLPAAVGVDAK